MGEDSRQGEGGHYDSRSEEERELDAGGRPGHVLLRKQTFILDILSFILATSSELHAISTSNMEKKGREVHSRRRKVQGSKPDSA